MQRLLEEGKKSGKLQRTGTLPQIPSINDQRVFRTRFVLSKRG
jgi:hypothetical protein